MSCGVGRRHSSDPKLLWLWRRPAATAPIRPLAWEPPYAVSVVQKKKKEKKRNSHYGSAVKNLTSIHENMSLTPGLAQWVKDLALPQAAV